MIFTHCTSGQQYPSGDVNKTMVMESEDKLSRYHAEVLSRGVEALLPQHLPDRWLDHLLEEGTAYLNQEESVSISTLLVTVLALVDYQQGDASASLARLYPFTWHRTWRP